MLTVDECNVVCYVGFVVGRAAQLEKITGQGYNGGVNDSTFIRY